MALFHIDAPFTNDLLQQIINVDDVVLQLKVRNPIGEKCITTGQRQTDHGPTSWQEVPKLVCALRYSASVGGIYMQSFWEDIRPLCAVLLWEALIVIKLIYKDIVQCILYFLAVVLGRHKALMQSPSQRT